MKRNPKNWITKTAMALAVGAGIVSFAAPQASAESRDHRLESKERRERQEHNGYRDRGVNSHRWQEQQRYTYRQPYEQYGYRQFRYGQYGQYRMAPQRYYRNQNRAWNDHDDDDRYYQRGYRR